MMSHQQNGHGRSFNWASRSECVISASGAARLHMHPIQLFPCPCQRHILDVVLLGLRLGDTHVIRNAGGRVTEDALRSLVISQRLLGTDTILVIHHTD